MGKEKGKMSKVEARPITDECLLRVKQDTATFVCGVCLLERAWWNISFIAEAYLKILFKGRRGNLILNHVRAV